MTEKKLSIDAEFSPDYKTVTLSTDDFLELMRILSENPSNVIKMNNVPESLKDFDQKPPSA